MASLTWTILEWVKSKPFQVWALFHLVMQQSGASNLIRGKIKDKNIFRALSWDHIKQNDLGGFWVHFEQQATYASKIDKKDLLCEMNEY